MAFDPDEFIKTNKKAAASPEIQPVADGFNPDEFIKNTPAFVPGSEPALVADVPAIGMSAPGTPMTQPPDAGGVAPQLPVGGYGPGIGSQLATTGLGQTASAMAQPYGRAAQNVMGQYIASPLTKLAPDLASMAAGIPPPIATSQMLQATQQAGTAAMRSRVPAPAMPTFQTAPPTPTQVANNPMLAEMASRQAAAEAETLANRSMIQKIAMSKVMQMAAPALNTAARVAEPAGLAYNAYEAGNMARETQLGQRLAQGQGGAAQKAFRNMNVPYGPSFNQGITTEQARTILASKNQRDIQAFGGVDALRKRALGQ
jgi:hypothetical protein